MNVASGILRIGSSLQAEDYSALERSFISSSVADSAGIRRVTSEEGHQIVGRNDHEDYAGLVFPSLWPGETHVRSHRLRRDNPPYEIRDGVRKERDKYLSPPGYGNMLYFHPLTPAWILADQRMPIVFLEGQKKTLAMYRLSWETNGDGTEDAPFVPVGLNGVFGWRGTVAREESPRGQRVPVKGPIPDLGRVEWRGRKVYILFDTNVSSNWKVAAARNGLAKELTDRGAEVWLIDLPEEDGVNGIDDFLGKHGAEPGLKLFQTARRFDPQPDLAKLHYTDHGNEKAFEILFGNDFLYNWTAKQWLHWNGTIWEPDLTGRTDRAMVEVAVARLQATAAVPGNVADAENDAPGSRKAAVRAALRIQNVRVRESGLESATSSPRFARRLEDFDKNDYLFAASNGVIDLRTGQYRVGRREDMLTRATPVRWIPEATCELWERVLDDIFPGRPDMVEFLRRAVGYSLTGITREEVFFILHGSGRNGKGTFLRVLSALLGDYAATTEFSTLISDRDRNRGPRNDIAALAGKRFVTAQESREGACFDESLVKALTGGDLITARFLHKEFFTFSPTWKIWIATNHRPEIRGTDTGIWSRPKLIPFTVSFEGREDRDLKEHLLEALQLSGVLNWAVEGCRRYLEDGLSYPDEVLHATAEYREESDVVGRFLVESCVKGEYCRAKARPLYQAFSKWAEDAGESGMTETAFGRRMTSRGFSKKQTDRGNEYLGIGLRSEQD